MPDFTALVTPPKLVGPDMKPANGDIYVRSTNNVPKSGVIVIPFQAHGKIVNGEFKALDDTPFMLVVTPEGVALEIVVEIFQDSARRKDKYSINRTVSVPNQSTVTWDALTDVVPVESGSDYVIPDWVQSLLTDAVAAGEAATAGAATATTKASEAVSARDAAIAARNAAEAVGTTNDTIIAGRINTPASATYAALAGTYVARDSTPRIMKPLGNTDAGIFDWEHDAAAGYVNHYRTGPNSAAGTFHTAFGTDKGAGGAILISHKNSGAAFQIDHQAGASTAFYLKGYSGSDLMYAEIYKGSGGLTVRPGIGQAFKDGVTTAGSTTFTSALAGFTAADIGAVLVQQTSRGLDDRLGSIAAGSTIVSVTNATTVVLSQPAGFTGSGIIFRVGGRVPDATQSLLRFLDTDGSTVLGSVLRGGIAWKSTADFMGKDVATTGLTATGRSGQTADMFAVRRFGNATPVFRISNAGKAVAMATAFVSNADNATTDALTVQNYQPGQRGILVVGVAGQTGDQFAVQDPSNLTQSRFDKDGYFMTRKNAAPVDTQLNTGEMTLWLDSTNGAAKLMVKAKQANGTVVTGSVALA